MFQEKKKNTIMMWNLLVGHSIESVSFWLGFLKRSMNPILMICVVDVLCAFFYFI